MPTDTPTALPVDGPDDEELFDLDSLERENTPKPLRVRAGGAVYTLLDPKAVKWQRLVGIGATPLGDLLPLFIAQPEQREEFDRKLAELDGWQVDELADRYRKHFNIPSLGEVDASPGS